MCVSIVKAIIKYWKFSISIDFPHQGLQLRRIKNSWLTCINIIMSGTDKMLSMCMAKQLSSFKEPVYKKWKCEVAESSKGVIHVYILHYFKAFFYEGYLILLSRIYIEKQSKTTNHRHPKGIDGTMLLKMNLRATSICVKPTNTIIF